MLRTYKTFYLPDTAEEFDFSQYDYVVDAIDTVSGKFARRGRSATVPTGGTFPVPWLSCRQWQG